MILFVNFFGYLPVLDSGSAKISWSNENITWDRHVAPHFRIAIPNMSRPGIFFDLVCPIGDDTCWTKPLISSEFRIAAVTISHILLGVLIPSLAISAANGGGVLAPGFAGFLSGALPQGVNAQSVQAKYLSSGFRRRKHEISSFVSAIKASKVS